MTGVLFIQGKLGKEVRNVKEDGPHVLIPSALDLRWPKRHTCYCPTLEMCNTFYIASRIRLPQLLMIDEQCIHYVNKRAIRQQKQTDFSI